MGPRQRQGRSRSKTHALPIILLSFLGFLLIAGVAFGIGMVGNVNRWLSDLPDYTDANAYLVSEPTEHRRLQRQQDRELLHAKPQVHHQGRGLPLRAAGHR